MTNATDIFCKECGAQGATASHGYYCDTALAHGLPRYPKPSPSHSLDATAIMRSLITDLQFELDKRSPENIAAALGRHYNVPEADILALVYAYLDIKLTLRNTLARKG